MPRKHPPPTEHSQQVRDLLRRYACSVPYHEVRTRFLGNIATPKLSASPLNVAKGLWGNLARLALTRRQELDGFVEGLFDGANEIDLPAKANASLGVLAEMRAIMGGAHDLATRTVEPADPAQVQETFRHLRDLTRIMEREINAVVLDCTRARRQTIRDATAKAPTFH